MYFGQSLPHVFRSKIRYDQDGNEPKGKLDRNLEMKDVFLFPDTDQLATKLVSSACRAFNSDGSEQAN
jgi:hypothetical protein